MGAAGRSHVGRSGGGRAPTSIGVRRMPAVGERGSLTCARCLLRGAAGVAGALPETPMAATAALRPYPAGRAVRILPRAGRRRRPLVAARGRSSPRRAHLPAPPARRLRSPCSSRPASPSYQSSGTDPPPRPSLRRYWSGSPAPPPAMAGGRLRLGEPAGRQGESGFQPRCRLDRTRLTELGCDWTGRGCGRCRGEPLSWRS